jgi:uncharacterized protein (TIGR03435 family)
MNIRALAASGLLTISSIPLLAQSAATPPSPARSAPTTSAVAARATAAFDVADVHASPILRNFSPNLLGGDLSGDRYDLRQATMTLIIAAAYNLEPEYVQGGPSWLDWNHYDIEAKAPPTTSKEAVRLMLQSLLAERFSLVAHTGTAPMPAYVLTAPTGKAKLKESEGTGESSCKPQPPSANQPPGAIPQIVVACHNETMEQFAAFLRMIGDAAVGDTVKPVIDFTGLKGAYDFDLKWTPAQLLARAGSEGISIFDAVDKEMGIKLALVTAPRPVLIVDSVKETPTPNPPDLAKSMPPLPPLQFEVAVIKPAKPDENISHAVRGDQEDWRAITIKDHIRNAWDVNYNDEESLVGAPKWLGEDRFDILAKLPSDLSRGTTSQAPQLLKEEQQQMLRALIQDRCKMKFHWETRPITAYHLVAISPRLIPADPKARTRCDEGPGPDGKDPRLTNPVLNRLLTCQNITIAQFGVLLQTLANGYVFNPVFDDTGLKGSYDFTLSFSSAGLIAPVGGSAPSPDGASQPSEPSGAVSLFDAVKNQLGLRLEKQKRPLPVFVIDHIEEPTEN